MSQNSTTQTKLNSINKKIFDDTAEKCIKSNLDKMHCTLFNLGEIDIDDRLKIVSSKTGEVLREQA